MSVKYTRVHYNAPDADMESDSLANDSGCVDQKVLMSTPRMPIPEIVPHAPIKPKRQSSRVSRREHWDADGGSPVLPSRRVRRLFAESLNKDSGSRKPSDATSDLMDSSYSGEDSFEDLDDFIPLEWDYSDSGFLDEDDYMLKQGEITKSEV
jgi:hypothetical protein